MLSDYYSDLKKEKILLCMLIIIYLYYKYIIIIIHSFIDLTAEPFET